MRHIAFFRGICGKQLFSPCFISFAQLRRVLQNPQQISVMSWMCYAAIVCFGLCPCQHNGTYTRNVYPATPTKKPAQILRFAESEKGPLSRKISEKAAKNRVGKGTGPLILPKRFLISFFPTSKIERKKTRKSLKLLGFSRRYLFWFY